jgi:hypothetical protein
VMRSRIPSPSRNDPSVELQKRSLGMRIATAISLAFAVYGLIGFIYVAICAFVAINTLYLPLTHLFPQLREDTSGAISFIVSFVGFVVYRIVRDSLLRHAWSSTPAQGGQRMAAGRCGAQQKPGERVRTIRSH